MTIANIGSLTTLKSTLASMALHIIFILIGSFAILQNSNNTIELTGKPSSQNLISLSGFSSYVKVNNAKSKSDILTKFNKFENTTNDNKKSKISQITSSNTPAVEFSSQKGAETIGTFINSSGGNGTISGNQIESGDFDNGYIFSEIKAFFESRLSSTLSIRETQLIKIKVLLDSGGEVQDAMLVHGKLENNLLRKILNVAKNIPFKRFWKSGNFPKELIFPLLLTPQ